jgi:TetR/AcrR family transcriptional repressor of nem operon
MYMKDFSSKALATRERILAAANHLFYRHGYNATGIDRIIEDAGVTKGSFFYYFKNKEELAVAVLDWHLEEALAAINLEQLKSDPSPRHALKELFRRMSKRAVCGAGTCRIQGCFFGNFALELSINSDVIRAKVKEIFDGLRHLIEKLLVSAQARGEIGKDRKPKELAGVLLAMMEGAVLLDKVNQTEENAKGVVKYVETLL